MANIASHELSCTSFRTPVSYQLRARQPFEQYTSDKQGKVSSSSKPGPIKSRHMFNAELSRGLHRELKQSQCTSSMARSLHAFDAAACTLIHEAKPNSFLLVLLLLDMDFKHSALTTRHLPVDLQCLTWSMFQSRTLRKGICDWI